VSAINVIVATTSVDIHAESIASFFADSPDMRLLGERDIPLSEIDQLLDQGPPGEPCVLVLVGRTRETHEAAERLLTARPHLVLVELGVVGDRVRIGLRNPTREALLAAVRQLAGTVGAEGAERIRQVELASGYRWRKAGTKAGTRPKTLLEAAVNWAVELVKQAVARVPERTGEIHGLSVPRPDKVDPLKDHERPAEIIEQLEKAEQALDQALSGARDSREPLARLYRMLQLSRKEFQILALALAAELDMQVQRGFGFLLDDMCRRTGTLGLFSQLLGPALETRVELAEERALSVWLLLEGPHGRVASADEPVHMDPAVVQWVLGDRRGLEDDPRLRRGLRLLPWPGALLLQGHLELKKARELVRALSGGPRKWQMLAGTESATWRALIETGARWLATRPLRIETWQLAGLDLADVEECARRVARLARVTGRPLAIDATRGEGIRIETGELSEDRLVIFIGTLARHCPRAALIVQNVLPSATWLGDRPYCTQTDKPLAIENKINALRSAASGASAYVTEDIAQSLLARYPLQVDGLEQALNLAISRSKNPDEADPYLARLVQALRDIASDGLSRFARRIEPMFRLDDLVLPRDHKEQLVEIVDHVRLAHRVLDEWKFGEQLPYGRGVTALFFGPSGTGKTMAAIGIARELGVELLHLDLSQVVSKYIGETEKHIDRVFTDAERSGAALLIDEADGLLGRRGDSRTAQERWSNMEVSYVLQRLEAFSGLALLTSNLRQNVDSAFLRRLRFIVDFPPPDAAAREQIWRFCLPRESHQLDEAAFRLLARKIDLTGGNIRQVSIRAAFLAAAEGVLINIEHIARAARAELAKLGLPPVDLETPSSRRAA